MNELKSTDPIAYRTEEACRYLNMNRKQLEALRRAGKIRYIRIGRIYLYPISCLDDFIAKNIGNEISKEGIVYERC